MWNVSGPAEDLYSAAYLCSPTVPIAPSPPEFMQQAAFTAFMTLAQSVASVPCEYLEDTLTFLPGSVSNGSGSERA